VALVVVVVRVHLILASGHQEVAVGAYFRALAAPTMQTVVRLGTLVKTAIQYRAAAVVAGARQADQVETVLVRAAAAERLLRITVIPTH
jgi:hypothetical protein